MDRTELKKRPKKKLGSYPYLSVVFSITLALFVLGLFGLLLLHTNQLTRRIQENVEMQVYLAKDLTTPTRDKILTTITNENYVVRKDSKPEVEFISKEEAAEEFKESTGEDFSEFLGDNPLRDLIRIKIDPSYQEKDSLQTIITSLESIKGVYEVAFVSNLVDSINSNLTKIGLILLSFAVILVLVVILLINNTIKLALFSQRFLIRSMQLVGATRSFIRLPFLRRASFYGIISGILAVGGLYALLQYAYTEIAELQGLTNQNQLGLLFGVIIFMGVILATVSTFGAISKYLNMSLDDLY